LAAGLALVFGILTLNPWAIGDSFVLALTAVAQAADSTDEKQHKS
jgi:hypothetical protein